MDELEKRVVNIHTGKSVLKEHDLKEIKKRKTDCFG